MPAEHPGNRSSPVNHSAATKRRQTEIKRSFGMFLREDCCCPGTRASLKTTRFVLTSNYSRSPRHQNHNLQERERERALQLWRMKNKVLGSGPDVMKLNSQQLHSVSRRLSGSHRCCEMRHYFLQSYLRDWGWAPACCPSWQNQPPSLYVDSS